MREKLALVNLEASKVLDLGCGEAEELSHLSQRFPTASVTGVDASLHLLSTAKQRMNSASSGLEKLLHKLVPSPWRGSSVMNFVCADFGKLPYAANTIDVIWSNLALHWHPHPDQVLKEWRRVLRVGGVCMFSCFGPDTLRELRQAMQTVDQHPHMLDFIDMHDFGDMMVNAGLATPVMDMEKLTLRYEKVEQLLTDVRSLGGNPFTQSHQYRIGKRAYQQLLQNLEAQRGGDDRIPLTIELVYGHAFKPQATKRENGEAIVQFVPRPNASPKS